MTWGYLLLIASAFAWRAGQPAVEATGPQTPTDYASLSGSWKGNFSIRQRGNCSIDRGGRSDFKVKFLLEVEPDGTLKAGVAMARMKESPELTWRGQFHPDQTVSMDAPAAIVCGGQLREYRLNFFGKVTEKKGKQQLELEAEDPGCPEMKCRFTQGYKLKRE